MLEQYICLIDILSGTDYAEIIFQNIILPLILSISYSLIQTVFEYPLLPHIELMAGHVDTYEDTVLQKGNDKAYIYNISIENITEACTSVCWLKEWMNERMKIYVLGK